MERFRPFELERWQSTYENEVAYNLSDSGVHPLSLGELRALCRDASIDDVSLGYGQTNGSEALRARIAALYPDADAASVTVANGSAEANFAAMWALAAPGERIAVVVPTYMQTHGLATAFGADVVEIPLHEELGWQPDPDEVGALIRQGVRAVVVTNPVNPTGTVLSAEARQAIVEAAADVGAWIVADEVYAGAERSGERTPTFYGAYPRTIATGSLSKAYGLPGLRLGWAVTTPAMAEELWARRDYSTIAPSTISDRLGTLALEPATHQRLLARTRAAIEAGLAVLEPWLTEQGIFRWRPPQAGAVCFVRYDLPVSSAELAERLRTEQSVLVVPGSQFGIEHTLRLGTGAPAGELSAALERIARTLEPLRRRKASISV